MDAIDFGNDRYRKIEAILRIRVKARTIQKKHSDKKMIAYLHN